MKIIINNDVFDVDIADNFKKRLFGLMGKRNIKEGMFFPKTSSIHTFFMKEDIDIIMVDKNNNVVYYQKSVPKNKIIIKKKAYHTIELPHGSIKDIKLGNHISIT